jgi:uncharacterized cupredoxin-like copper-binding protein
MCAVGLLGTLTSLGTAPALAQTRAASSTVTVTITSSSILLAPMQVPAGTVVFKIANKGKIPRNFKIAGKSTPTIAVGKSATLRVALPKSGTYLYLSFGKGHTAGRSGVLTVVDTCTNPASASVTVQMQEAPMKLSRQTVPCGTVTFVITNAGTIIHTFQIDVPNSTGVVAPGGQGPRLDPGQTASITVRFTTKGSAFYRCSETEHDEQYGETGSLTVV